MQTGTPAKQIFLEFKGFQPQLGRAVIPLYIEIDLATG
jgi:hypothetical protein